MNLCCATGGRGSSRDADLQSMLGLGLGEVERGTKVVVVLSPSLDAATRAAVSAANDRDDGVMACRPWRPPVLPALPALGTRQDFRAMQRRVAREVLPTGIIG
jgi:hypothetical protein